VTRLPVIALAAAAAGLAALPSQAAVSSACSANGVAAGSYRVIHLTAVGISCAKARSVAATVAHQLAGKGVVDVPGVAGFSMSTRSCTGCRTTTEIAVIYPSGGKVTISLAGHAVSIAPPSLIPTPTPLPSPGPGPLTV